MKTLAIWTYSTGSDPQVLGIEAARRSGTAGSASHRTILSGWLTRRVRGLGLSEALRPGRIAVRNDDGARAELSSRGAASRAGSGVLLSATALILAVATAVSYGCGDFFGAVGGRRASPAIVSLLVQLCGTVVVLVGVVVLHPPPPPWSVLGWGSLAGAGGALGNLALYQGLARGRIAVVAPLSAVLTAALPAALGIASGDRESAPGWVGFALVLPAIVLVSLARAREEDGRTVGSAAASQGAWRGAVWGLLSGTCFAVLLVGLDRAGGRSPAWSLLPRELTAVCLTAGLVQVADARRRIGHRSPATTRALTWAAPAALFGVAGDLLFLVTTGKADLSAAAFLTGLYPGVTVLLGAVVLGERPTSRQIVGLLLTVASIGLIGLGGS